MTRRTAVIEQEDSSNVVEINHRAGASTAEPAELAAGRALREAVVAINARAESRVFLTEDERRAALGLNTLAEAFSLKSRFASRAGDPDDDVAKLVSTVARYVVLSTECERRTFPGGVVVEVPAIESPTLRTVLHRLGVEIVGLIDASIAAAYTRERERSIEHRARLDAFEYFRARTRTRGIIQAIEDLMDDPTTPHTLHSRLVDDLGTLLYVERQETQSRGETPRELRAHEIVATVRLWRSERGSVGAGEVA